MRRQWASEYGGAHIYSEAEVAHAGAAGNPNLVFSEQDEQVAADCLWARLRALHANGALMGCSHRCLGVDHSTEDDVGGGRYRCLVLIGTLDRDCRRVTAAVIVCSP